MTIRNLLVLATHVGLSALLAAVIGFAAYRILLGTHETAQIEQAEAYIRVRAEQEQAFYNEALAFNRAAERAFRRRLSRILDEDVSAQFDVYFPLMPDGTRRSVPGLFDGFLYADGDYVFGIGAFMGDGAGMTMDDKRRYLAAFQAVRSVGEAHLGRFSSLYYFTPDRRVVIFAPERPDRLEFYRFNAPADFDLRGDEDDALLDLRLNPESAMRCTPLSRFVYDESGERSASACRLPVRAGERLLGAFGTSMMMDDHLADVLSAPPAHGINMLFDREGNVITRGDQEHIGAFSAELVSQVEPMEVIAMVRDDPRAHGVFRAASTPHVIAFSRIRGPDWVFAAVIDLAPAHQRAEYWARLLFLIVFGASIALTLLRGILSRLRPVRRLL